MLGGQTGQTVDPFKPLQTADPFKAVAPSGSQGDPFKPARLNFNTIWSLESLPQEPAKKDIVDCLELDSLTLESKPPQFSDKFLLEDEAKYNVLPTPTYPFVPGSEWFPLRKSHSLVSFQETSHSRTSSVEKSVCRFFLQGYCSRGTECLYSHQIETRKDLRPALRGKRRNSVALDEERFHAVEISELQGQFYNLCKDQFGCRYLQKQIEVNGGASLDLIFDDILLKFSDLMIDPFGNYLCQKLVESCSPKQRRAIIVQVRPDFVNISLNMHGTRAVQKLIENATDVEEIKMITEALNCDVIALIKDLNGNHVIQKCLSKLDASANQFVFNAVSLNCIDVATHRHGCCVLQRCIDHAVDSQRLQLVEQIAINALSLVQDAFGNYVVQYVLDLEDLKYSQYIVKPFVGHVCTLSMQKFSSNVIEKVSLLLIVVHSRS